MIPDGSHPRTTKETEADFGMRDALSCVFVLRGAGRKIDCDDDDDGCSVDVGLGDEGGNGEEAEGEGCGVGGCGMER